MRNAPKTTTNRPTKTHSRHRTRGPDSTRSSRTPDGFRHLLPHPLPMHPQLNLYFRDSPLCVIDSQGQTRNGFI